MRRGRPALLAPQPLPEAASALSAAAAAAGAEWGYPSVRAVADTDTDTDTVGTASSRMGRVRLGGGGWPVAECTLRDDADGGYTESLLPTPATRVISTLTSSFFPNVCIRPATHLPTYPPTRTPG